MYGHNDYKERKFAWPKLSSQSRYRMQAWGVGGDFNITSLAHENFPTGRATKGWRQFGTYAAFLLNTFIIFSGNRSSAINFSDAKAKSTARPIICMAWD